MDFNQVTEAEMIKPAPIQRKQDSAMHVLQRLNLLDLLDRQSGGSSSHRQRAFNYVMAGHGRIIAGSQSHTEEVRRLYVIEVPPKTRKFELMLTALEGNLCGTLIDTLKDQTLQNRHRRKGDRKRHESQKVRKSTSFSLDQKLLRHHANPRRALSSLLSKDRCERIKNKLQVINLR